MNEQRQHCYEMEHSTAAQRRACGKTSFPSKKNASAVARIIGGTMNAYKCPLCRRWHIGHSNRRRRQRA